MTRALAVCALLLPHAAGLCAQTLRATGSTSVRYVEVRTLQRDSVAADSASAGGLLRQLADGRIVRCIPGEAFCRDLRPGAVESALPVTQDLDVSAWGFGQGLRVYAQLRARETLAGNSDLWPRAERTFDVLALFAELERERWRLRAGRQWKVSGLGFYNFDGLALTWNQRRGTLEAYAGRSLVRGLNEGRSAGALEAIEALAPPATGVLFGLDARYRAAPRFALGALYQIDFRADGRGIYSELAAANAVLTLPLLTAEATIEADLATGSLNEASLHLRAATLRSLRPSAEVRRYRPYFELWTIWGAFSPVGFDEFSGAVSWAAPGSRVLLRATAGYRQYGDLGSDLPPDVLKTEGWSAGANASWAIDGKWRADASYRIDFGFGAARRDGSAALTRVLGAGSVSAQAIFFQSLYEFRLDEGMVAGLGGEVVMPLSGRLQLFGSGAVYRHLDSGLEGGLDWNQRRASLRVQWTVGSEPRARAAVGGAP